MFIRIRLALLVVLLARAACGAATYYIDATSGNNASAGTSSGTAWQTFANATNISSVIAVGDTILLNRGDTWLDTFVFPTNSVTLGAYGTGAQPKIDGGGTRRHGVNTALASNTITRNICITNIGGGTGAGWTCSIGSNTIEFCTITWSTVDAGVAAGGAAHMLVRSNIITGCADEGITQHDTSRAWVIGCIVTNNVEGLNNSGTDMTLVVEDTIFGNNGNGVGGGGDIGALTPTVATFRRCYFPGRPDGTAFKWFTGGEAAVSFEYCVFDASDSGNATQPSWSVDCPTKFLNCVWYGVGTGAIYVNNSAVASMTNCIASGITRFGALSGGGTLITDHCILYNIPSNVDSAQTANTSLLTSDPLFVSPATGNFRLSAGSPGINTGVNLVGLTTDLAGLIVANPPEIGAYEIVNDQSDQWVMNTNLNLTGQESGLNYFWVHYDGTDTPNGSYIGWMSYDASFRTNIVATVQLFTNKAAGTYDLFLKTIPSSVPTNARVSIGDGTLLTSNFTNTGPTKRWSGPWTLTSSIAFTSVVVNFNKGEADTTTARIFFEGLFITTNRSFGQIDNYDRDRVVSFQMPAVTNSAPYRAGNILDDASFEGWPSHGWAFEKYEVDQRVSQRSLAHTAAANVFHGTKSLYATNGLTVYSRIFRRRAWSGSHSLSFWMKSTNTSTRVTVTVFSVITPPPGIKVAVTNMVVTAVAPPASTNWTRYSTNVVLWDYPSPYYQLKIECGLSDHPELETSVFVDAVQLEEGPLTDFAPRYSAEFGLQTTNTGNIFHTAPVIQILGFNNAAGTASRTFSFDVFDGVRNSRLTNGSLSITCGASNVVPNALTLASLTNGGAYRIVGRLDGNPDSDDELIFSILPVNILSTNYTLGVHPNATILHSAIMTNLGIVFAHGSSPGGIISWNPTEPTEGAFTWTAVDARISELADSGAVILATPESGNWPAFANDAGNGYFLLPKFSNFWFAVGSRYGSAGTGKIKYWQFPNEPQYAYSTAFQAAIYTNFVRALRNADANAIIIGGGGETASTSLSNTLSLVDSSILSQIAAYGIHAYPFDFGVNRAETDERFKDFRRTFPTLDLWNTETGVGDAGAGFTRNSGFVPVGLHYRDYDTSYRWSEQVVATELALVNYLRGVGMGFGKHFYYDSRIRANPSYQRAEYTALEFSDSTRPKLVVQALANQLIKNGRGTGAISNSAAATLEAYMITNANNIVALWCNDKSNRVVGVTNTSFVMLDEQCRPVALPSTNVSIGRLPVYLVSTTLSTVQLSNTIKFAKVTHVADATAPYVSIDLSPHGTITSNNFPLSFKWQAVDDTTFFTNSYSYALNGTNYSAWTKTAYLEMSSVAAGTYALHVKARDAAGNESAAMVGPEFSFGVASPVSRITVGTIRAGGMR